MRSDTEVKALIGELTGATEPAKRSPEEWIEAYGEAIDALCAAKSWPGVEGSPKHLIERMVAVGPLVFLP